MPLCKLIKLFIVALFVFPLTLACGKNGSVYTQQLASIDTPPGDDIPSDDGNDGSSISGKVVICSDLSLTGVSFPKSLDDFGLNVMALAMNISGSFEGHTGWHNISDNFDGQGVSLGLFNQNFGQGSLQPLMIKMRDTKLTKLKSFFTTTQYNSMANMLKAWEAGKTTLSKAAPTSEFPGYEDDYSDLDDPVLVEQEEGGFVMFGKGSASNKVNQASVDWSVKTVYSSGKFIAAWKTAFQNMAKSPEYVTLQVEKADAINKKAQSYLSTYSFNSMRAYLFFFDIVVQNGGISTAIKDKYMNWVKNNKNATETVKLKKLLEYRLTVVNPTYMNDVKSRKTAIIDGKGLVHGSNRNFPKEYCVGDWTAPYFSTNLNLL